MIDGSDVVLSVSDRIDAQTLEGVALYGWENGILPAGETARAERWTSLFSDNRIGRGLFATATHKGELVGFICLIDIEMRVGGVARRAGKAEFWVVKPDYLKVFPEGSRTRLPWTLFERLRQAAGSHGYEVVLTVSRLAARDLHRCGDVCIVTPELACFSADDPGLGQRLAAAAGDLRGRVREVASLDTEVADAANAFIASTPAMINSRFTADRYRRFLLEQDSGPPLLLIFDNPKTGAASQLIHWSGLPESQPLLAAVLAAAATPGGMKLEIPATQLRPGPDLERLGFTRTARPLNDCFLMATDPALDLAAVGPWQITHGHMRFYTSLP